MSGIKFKRNKETGELEAYKGGEKIGEVKTMGDEVTNTVRSQDDKTK